MTLQHLKDRHDAEVRTSRAEAQHAAGIETAEREHKRHEAAAVAWAKEKQTLAEELEEARAENCNGQYGLHRDLRTAKDA
eukprot:CAMPEP_0197612948 /NCGR_PEP_ID=MMETSP1326-20131121/58259_1 /TAXON_ID=1155430 /ORGANISM="Genus nov. species nov., Strain RCC2288" /LENGTH=79 /DNA_ID=CAMNT_0043181767 /DNA_START=145 /DNA_END=381 /DNA_ORIENTATION=+